MARDKIVLLFPDGVGIRNYLYSDVFKGFEKDLILFHNFDDTTINDICRNVNFEKDYTIPVYKESFKEKFLRELICYLRLQHNAKITQNKTILSNWNPLKNTFLKKMFYFLIESISSLISNYNYILKLEDLYQKEIRKHSFYHQVRALLCEINPTHLFCSHQRGIQCAPVFAAAQDLNIETVTVIFSWDNLPKARMALKAKKYFVWSNYMKDEIKLYYPEISKENIVVTGTPQFEFYSDESNIIEKETFYKQYNLDFNKKIICFSGDDAHTSPDDPKYLEDIVTVLVQNGLDENYQILFRRCPVDITGRYDEICTANPTLIKKVSPIWNRKSNAGFASIYPSIDDVKLLVSTVYYSDIVVNVGSTMAFDFAMYDKPCIFINYDQNEKLNPNWSTKKIYEFQHFKSMPSPEAVYWLNNKSDLISILNNEKLHKNTDGMKLWKNIVLGDYKEASSTIKKELN
ncbi:hypothetical protein EQG63_09705 [Flavobacterium amnicola]|uniref:UDP-glycosyltransferase n=1 Tax=Flavobacterium amnicola TaxID=2506422 RepID=A0A4Q1K2A8_9FLAO|nr:hypothetical protein [Flavobacterium amnicola]RXR17748.1 hypothetical protein EQG63_09705 [Flavobacterium amnicola]